MQNKLLFIVGVGRSGTTLLQNMMNSHSQVAFIPEINFTRRFLFNTKLLSQYRKGEENFINIINNDKWLGRLDREIIDNIDFIKISENKFSRELYRQIISSNCQKQDKRIGGDKDPRSIEIVDKIDKIIPNIHWIHIIRDPRDVIVSKQKADWSKKGNILKHIISGSIQLKLANKWKNKYSNKFTEIYYEDLIQHPSESLIELCGEIGIRFEEVMMDFQDSAKSLIADDELDWKKSVFNAINKNNFSKWKKSLSRFEIALVESINIHAFNSYNYKKENPPILIFNKIFILILKVLTIIISKIYFMLRFLIYR